jgi:hypothetical protein
MRTGLCVCTLLVTLSAAWDLPPASDSDRDGIADEREQALLEKFRPTFLISVADCDFLPAEFLAGSEKPRAVARNGTIYGQVSPRSSSPEKGALIEIHYYHLWNRDCGRRRHALDAEHIAVLVSGEDSQPVSAWRAVYWYAAAHENTLCDRSAAVKALTIGAEDRGAVVWVSQDKHASFLSPAGCGKGCGQDRCGKAIALSPPAIINVGEPGAPLNGAVWTRSRAWPLAEKMRTAFSDDLLAQLAGAESEVQVRGPRQHLQPGIAAGGTSLDAVALSNDHTSTALSAAGARTNRALGMSARSVGRSFKRAGSFIRQTLPVEQPNSSR